MSSENLVELDDANWEKTVEMGDRPVAVMFSSPTCPYCKRIFLSKVYFDYFSFGIQCGCEISSALD